MSTEQYVIPAKTFTGTVISVLLEDGTVAYSSQLHNNRQGNLTFEQYKEKVNPDVKLVSENELDTMIKDFYLGKPAVEVTQEHFDGKFRELTPEEHYGGLDFERFNMVEKTAYTFTSQYARYQNRYLCKTVDVTDRSTYLTPDYFEEFFGD